MEKFDVAVIGGGPAGYAGAMRAIDFGKRVALIEENKVGGAGIYNGALSSKTMWEISEKVAHIRNSKMGSAYELKFSEVKQIINEAIYDRKTQYSVHLKLLQTEVTKNLFSLYRGKGSLMDTHQIKITKQDGKQEIIWAENIILATGSRPRKLETIAIDEKIIMTSDGIHHLEEFPKSLVILGAGVIGCEFATIFANFGKTKVYLIDRADRILPFEDEDIAQMVAGNLEKMGVCIHQTSSLEKMITKNGGVQYTIRHKDGHLEEIQVEKAMLSVGRVPNIEGLGLENAGVDMSKRGVHIGDNDTQTNIPNIYAVGDVSGRIALVNMGEIEARHAVEKMYGGKTTPLSYDNVCTIMFLPPEVASVGLNEQQCIQKNLAARVVKIDYSCIPRAIAMRSTQGFFKIIVTDDDDMKILGMRAIGAHASSAIQAVGLLIKMNHGIEILAELIHPHPSIIEGVQECVRMLLGKPVFKSEVFKDKLQCYRLVEGKKVPLKGLMG